MHDLYNLKDMLCEELQEYGRRGSISASDLGKIDTISHALKNIDKIIEAKSESEYSRRRYYGDDMAYDGGNSYDRMTRRSYRDGSYDARSMRQYSRANEDVIHGLETMIDKAPDDKTRDEMRKMLDKMQQM